MIISGWQTWAMSAIPPLPGWIRTVLLALLPILAGCSSIGPGTVSRDRLDYSQSVGESWKRQALLNIVKLRYLDPPVSVEVGQIVAGYTLETDVTLGGNIGSGVGNNNIAMGGSGRFTDRPTVTYTPMTGNRYMHAAMMPLDPEQVFFMIQAGWPADGVLYSAVASFNGLKNQQVTMGGVTPPSPEFLRALELLRKIQISGGVALRVQQNPQKQETVLLTFHTQGITAETLNDIAELRRLLRLNPEAREFRLVFGATPINDQEVAVITRSPLQIMSMMSAYVDIPPEHIAQGRAVPGLDTNAGIHIYCSSRRMADAFTAVSYRDRWFWIDDRDLKTKRAFALLMMLFTLGDTGQHEPLPLITIPAQ
jgi:hypothetical protein